MGVVNSARTHIIYNEMGNDEGVALMEIKIDDCKKSSHTTEGISLWVQANTRYQSKDFRQKGNV